ncbi:MAG: hypothetical protein QM739_15155 [Propionivibrio sp.]
MSINILIVTTANRTRRFKLEAADDINRLLDSLKRSAQIFSGKPLIVGSAGQTDIFSSASIACVELETAMDLAGYIPGAQHVTITALNEEEAISPFEGGVEGESFKARIDFFFEGGHVLNTLVEGERKAALAERLMNLTGILERQVMFYRLPEGGIGLMNPQSMTRVVITPGVPDLPSDAWIADPIQV